VFALAWALGGQPAAQFIAPLFFTLSLLAAWILARDSGASAGETLAGVVLAASLPVLHWSESVPKNDAPVTFFLLCSLAAALRWRKTSEFKWVQAGVLFLACAFANKDLAILGAIPLAVVFLPAAWRQPRRLRALASLALIFAVIALIWSVRRLVLTGNPIFPFVPGKTVIISGWPPDPSLRGTILRMLRLLWDLHFHGHDFSETVLIAPLGIVFVFFWPVWLFTRRPNRAEYLCLGFGTTALLLWGVLSPYVRYAVAPLAVLALLTGVRLVRFWRASGLLTRASLAAASVWVLIPAVCASMIIELNAPQLRYVAGASRRSGSRPDGSARDWENGRAGIPRSELRDLSPAVSYFGFTACPPNCWRMAASIRAPKEFSCRDRKRIIRDSPMTGAGTAVLIDSSTVQRPSPESSTQA
jgi:hypothetical protein